MVLALLVAFWLGTRGGDSPAPTDDPTTSGDRSPSQQPSDTASEQSESPTRSPTRTPSQSPTRTPSETPTDSPSETPTETEAPTVEVDPEAYVGRDHGDVENELRALGLVPVPVELDNPGEQPEGIVESVEPSGPLQEGDRVTVSFWGAPAAGQEKDDEGNDEG